MATSDKKKNSTRSDVILRSYDIRIDWLSLDWMRLDHMR